MKIIGADFPVICLIHRFALN